MATPPRSQEAPLQSLISFLTSILKFLVPCSVVFSYQQGVLFRLGQPVRRLTSSNGVCGTGLHLFPPLMFTAEVENTVLEVLETTGQTVLTRDLRSFTVSCSLSYQIVDLRDWYRVQDFDKSLQALVKGLLSSSFLEFAAADLGDPVKRARLEEHAHLLVAEEAVDWGVEVDSLRLIDVSPSRTINLLNL